MPEAKEQRWMAMRPTLLVDRLAVAISAFEGCSKSFRDAFTSSFLGDLVTKSMISESITLRLVSAHAVGVVLRLHPDQDHVYNTIVGALAFGRVLDAEAPVLLSLCEVLKDRDESSSWKHALPSVRYSIVRLWGTIAGCTTDRAIYQGRLFDCLHFAVGNPSLELLSQTGIQKMSRLRGYESADQMIVDESGCLWGMLVDIRMPAESIPLNFVSDSLLGIVKKLGLRNVRSWEILQAEVDNINTLTLHATAEFVFVALSSALPIFLSKFTPEELNDLIQPIGSSIQPDKISYLESLKNFGNGSVPSEHSRRSFLEPYVPAILAYGMLETARNACSTDPHQLVVFSVDLVHSVHDDQARRNILHAAIRHLLKIQGRDLSEEVDTLSILFDLDSLTPENWPGVVDVVREGAIEFLLECRYWLDRAQVVSYKISTWQTMAKLIHVIMKDHDGAAMVREVAVRTMLGILQSRPLQCCHLQVLALIGDHFDEAVSHIVLGKKSDRVLIYQLVGTILEVHERCQKRILCSFKQHFEIESRHEMHSFGILLKRRKPVTGGVWSWCDDVSDLSSWILCNSDQCSKFCSPDDTLLAIVTYNLLDKVINLWIGDSAQRADNIHVDLATFIRDHDGCAQLAPINRKFNAQILFKDRRMGLSDMLRPSESLSSAISRFVFFEKELRVRDAGRYHLVESGSLGIDARLLLGQLVALKSALAKDTTGMEASMEMYCLCRHLLDIATDDAIELELRIEASRCIGYLGQRLVGEVAVLGSDGTAGSEEDWLKNAGTDKNILMTFTLSKVLEILVDHIKSEPPLSALASLEVCKELASTHEGVDAIHRMTVGNSKDFVASLRPPLLKKKPNLLTPSGAFVDNAIRVSRKGNEENRDSNSWCWSPELWNVSGLSFEAWIKRLVSSIIICCYRIKRDPNEVCIRGLSLSFRAFARISAISSSIATYLFPRLILDLCLSDTVTQQELNRNPVRLVRFKV